MCDEKFKLRQKYALSVTLESLKLDPSFKQLEITNFKDYTLINAEINKIECLIFPISHDWTIAASIFAEFSDFSKNVKHLISMVAPDASCIIYEMKPFDFISLEENVEISDSD